MSEIPDFIQRLLDERKELNEKYTKLNQFLDKGVQPESVSDLQFVLLKLQSNAMKQYLDILDLRIDELGYSEYKE